MESARADTVGPENVAAIEDVTTAFQLITTDGQYVSTARTDDVKTPTAVEIPARANKSLRFMLYCLVVDESRLVKLFVKLV